MFVSDGRTLTAHTFANGYTAPAFNVCSAEMVRACLEAASDLRAPVSLQVHPSDSEQLVQTVALAKRYADELGVPVILHLDHSLRFEVALTCLRAGYSSVMHDGAGKPLESVLREAKRLAEVAHPQEAAVEVAAESFNAGTVALTEPGNAVNLFAAGVDIVAVSVGSEHAQEGRLEEPSLAEIEALKQKSFVLHGGSGICAEDYVAARAALRNVAEEKRWCGAAGQADGFGMLRPALRGVSEGAIRL